MEESIAQIAHDVELIKKELAIITIGFIVGVYLMVCFGKAR